MWQQTAGKKAGKVQGAVAQKAKLSLMLEMNFAKFSCESRVKFRSSAIHHKCSLWDNFLILVKDGFFILHHGLLVLALARVAIANTGPDAPAEFSANILRKFLFRHYRCPAAEAAGMDD